jgi:hypothetical protein
MPANAQQPSTPRFDELLTRVRGEYREMPGLSLTIDQAQRLWMMEHATCAALFAYLVDARFLRKSRHGRFVKTDASDPAVQR